MNILENVIIFVTTTTTTKIHYPHPKTFAHERIDDRVGEAVGHGEPVAGQVGGKNQIEFALGAEGNESITEKELKHFDGSPADEIDQQHGEHHFNGLQKV